MIDQLSGEIGAWLGWVAASSARIEKSWLGSRRLAVISLFTRSRRSHVPQLGQSAGAEILNALNQCDTQHLGDSPEFANRQRVDGLIGLNERKDILPV